MNDFAGMEVLVGGCGGFAAPDGGMGVEKQKKGLNPRGTRGWKP